jgi:D-beta-D-heptose 7-phosphate kinase / D-beta-D-heptose 1-phosphate adenosyltransferase
VAKILVIGDVMLDRYTEGEVTRISPEGPIPVVKQTRDTYYLGGAANVANNIVKMGHQALLLGVTGRDAAAQQLVTLLNENGLQSCLPQGVKPTIVKHRIVADGQVLLRVDQEDVPFIGMEADLLAGLAYVQQQAAEIKAIVISDYAKGTISPGLLQSLAAMAQQHGIPILVDTKPGNVGMYRGAALIKPNLAEAKEMLTQELHPGLYATTDPYDNAAAAVGALLRHYQIGAAVVTMGSKGCCYSDPEDNNRPHYYDVVGKGPVVDSCGAGDTTMAALAVGVVEGMSICFATRFAMAAAGLAVQTVGIAAPTRDQIEEFILEHHPRKQFDMQELLAIIARKRRLPHPVPRVVLANGCFDGFHAGHLETLRFAKRQGEIVVVAYNDDASLQACKGPTRPHVPDSYRSSHLACQDCVDFVVRFDGDVEKLVRAIQPDILVKGGDTPGIPPGADYVAARGGRLEKCPIDSFYVTVDRNHPFQPASPA